MRTQGQLQVGRRTLQVSNLDKVLYPKAKFTKGNIIDYYVQISSWLLPHLKNRPVSFKRYPDGVEGEFFYEKNCPKHRPPWMKTVSVAKTNGTIDYCVLNELPALVWAANLAALELHTFLHRAPALDRPTAVVFDLDPGAPADIVNCCEVSLQLRAALQELNLECWAKTSGSKGLQVYVPLNSPVDYARTKMFAREMATRLEKAMPDRVVSQMSKDLRKGKVFIDWSQNDAHKTTISVYSLRARDFPTVSAPVAWREIEGASKRREKLSFRSDEVIARVKKSGDLFEPLLNLKQKLPKSF